MDLFISCLMKTTLFQGELIDLKATHHLATQKNFKPKIHSEGTIGQSSFMLEIKLHMEVLLRSPY